MRTYLYLIHRGVTFLDSILRPVAGRVATATGPAFCSTLAVLLQVYFANAQAPDTFRGLYLAHGSTGQI